MFNRIIRIYFQISFLNNFLLSSYSLTDCQTTIKPIELWKPFIFNPDLLNPEYSDLQIESNYFCVLLIRIDYQSNIVYIILTTESSGQNHIELLTHIDFKSQSIINQYTFMCKTLFCNLDHLQIISITGQINWLLDFEYYLNIASSLTLLLYNHQINHNEQFFCYKNNQKRIFCNNNLCAIYFLDRANTGHFSCGYGYLDKPEDHYITLRTTVEPTRKTIIFIYRCDTRLCNSLQTFHQIKELFNITSDAYKLNWSSTESIKQTNKTTQQSAINQHIFTSTTKEITSTNEEITSTNEEITSTNSKFYNPTIEDTSQLTSNKDNQSQITNNHQNMTLRTTISTSSMIKNKTKRLESEMFLVLFSVLGIKCLYTYNS